MSEDVLAAKIDIICQTLKEMKMEAHEFQTEIRSELASMKECGHCTNAPAFREKFKTQTLLITTLGALMGGFFMLFLAHLQGK